nr:helix-turn-helix transcriptional regulator [Deltaproteobacteria bacterium]
MEAFFSERAPSENTTPAPRVPSLLALLQGDPSLVRVDLLAERAGLSMRSIQRLFLQEVGVPASQVVRRARMQEAASASPGALSPGTWADLAAELGYTDQSHFIRDFKQQIGQTPTRYARRCAGRP